MTTGSSLVAVPEFGPFDLVCDWAHELYSATLYDEAVHACRAGLLVVEPAGDRLTGLYLRYIECLAHEGASRWGPLRRQTEDLLQRLDDTDGPYWRAKALGLHSQALLHQGMFAAAVDGLAEAYGVVVSSPELSYNRGSAAQAVSAGLQTALLFGPSIELLRVSLATAGGLPAALLHANIHIAVTEGMWGYMLELVGRAAEAHRHYVRAGQAALRAEKVPGGGEEPYALQIRALQEFARQRLRVPEVDIGLLERHAEANPGRQAGLTWLAAASAHARAGRMERAREIVEQVRASSTVREREAVVGWTADLWLAELDEHAQGATVATRSWRAVAARSLERLWRDRAGRFEHLLARRRLAQLSADAHEQDLRLWEDPLTSIGNRRVLDALTADDEGSRRPVLFLDVDHFKDVNDRFGHDVGDEVLRRIAGVLRAVSRPGDVPVRYGGDEFVIVLASPGDPERTAALVTAALDAVDWEGTAAGLTVTASVGVGAAGPEALQRADAALLAAKAARPPRPAGGADHPRQVAHPPAPEQRTMAG